MKPIRIGFIGAGNVAKNRHLPGLRNVPDVTITRVWSRKPEAAKSFAQDCGATTVDSWEAVAEAGDVDAVIIATPPILHEPATVRSLAAGKHVLCQARMARNVQEALSMLRAADRSGRVTSLYPPKPGLKGDRVIRRLLREKHVGEIREVRVTALASPPAQNGYRWTNDPAVVGVNAMEMGMWVEILNRWVGPAVRVSAVTRCHALERISTDGSRAPAMVPDSIVIAATHQGGAVASYHFSACATAGPGHRIEIFGTEGALAYQLFAEELFAARNGQSWQGVPVPPDEVRTQSTDAEFIAAIRGGPAVEPSFRDGLAYMEFSEAVAASAFRSAAVNLPLERPLMEAWQRPL